MATALASQRKRRAIPRDHQVVTPQQETDHFIALANEARRDFEDASKDYRILVRRESQLEDTRHREKLAACLRMKEQVNPLTDKPFSGTGAQDYAEVDPRYSEHLATQRDVVFEKNAAYTRMESARLRVLTSVAAIQSIGGVS